MDGSWCPLASPEVFGQGAGLGGHRGGSPRVLSQGEDAHRCPQHPDPAVWLAVSLPGPKQVSPRGATWPLWPSEPALGHYGASWKPQKTVPPAARADAGSRPGSAPDLAVTWTQLLFLNLDGKFTFSGFSKVGVTCDVRKHLVQCPARSPCSIKASPQDACAPLRVRASG